LPFEVESAQRVGLLLVLCAFCSLFLSDFVRIPDMTLQPGQIASRDIRSPIAFTYADHAATEKARESAARSVVPVYDFDATLGPSLQKRISRAFEEARRRWGEARLDALAHDLDGLPAVVQAEIGRDFLRALQMDLEPSEVQFIAESGFGRHVETIANDLLGQAMRKYVVSDRAEIPLSSPGITVIELLHRGQAEITLTDFERIHTAAEVRQTISLYALERFEDGKGAEDVRAAVQIARAGVRANFSINQLLTRERRVDARSRVGTTVQTVSRGASIARKGEQVTADDVRRLQELKDIHADRGFWTVYGSLFLLGLLLFGTVFRFASGTISKFADSIRELTALAVLMALCLGLARLVLEISGAMPGFGAGRVPPESVWYLAPVAGLTLTCRILMNSETALVFAVVAGTLCGLMMDQQALYAVFFVVSSLTAAGALSKDRERRSILRSGVYTGMVNAGFVFVMGLVQMQMGDPTLSAVQPIWDAGFAFSAGLLSAFLVLFLVPIFESFGFVTNLQLLELANMNHPLLRNLMLRAPGTYQHSLMVGTLAEAAAETVGCNALLARVASYFHDIGKAVTPQYFVENQLPGHNRHDRLSPHMSARIIVDHVRNGAAIARRHKLPQPIIDNILMHHGTGLLYYFFKKAREDDPEALESDFRYPGPRPNSREAGIIHLADKVEAACRSIRQPTPERIREMIQRIVNTTLADGQLEECPLTIKEIYAITTVFQDVIMAIHHQRIEYPDAREKSPGDQVRAIAKAAVATGGTTPKEAVITLEILPAEAAGVRELKSPEVASPEPEKQEQPKELAAPSEGDGTMVDYESVDMLPDVPLDDGWPQKH
jgi:putative nucleotidyltransferase with HDIG domain